MRASLRRDAGIGDGAAMGYDASKDLNDDPQLLMSRIR